jgi:hypothetical protein
LLLLAVAVAVAVLVVIQQTKDITLAREVEPQAVMHMQLAFL